MGITTAPAPSRAWRRWTAAVPVLVAVSAVLLAARISFDGDTYQDCDYLGPSLRMYVTACAAPAFAVAAGLLCVVLARGLRSRGERLTGTSPGRLAAAASCVVPVLILVELAFLYWTFAPDPAGGTGCSGLALMALPALS
jgi:hypothetical protein